MYRRRWKSMGWAVTGEEWVSWWSFVENMKTVRSEEAQHITLACEGINFPWTVGLDMVRWIMRKQSTKEEDKILKQILAHLMTWTACMLREIY